MFPVQKHDGQKPSAKKHAPWKHSLMVKIRRIHSYNYRYNQNLKENNENISREYYNQRSQSSTGTKKEEL